MMLYGSFPYWPDLLAMFRVAHEWVYLVKGCRRMVLVVPPQYLDNIWLLGKDILGLDILVTANTHRPMSA